MNKHVVRLAKEASDARKMIEDSDSDSDDSDEENKRNGGSRQSGAKSGEKPSEDQVEKLEERLEAAQADQKNLFLIIFQVHRGQITLKIVGYHFSSRLTATLKFCLIYFKST